MRAGEALVCLPNNVKDLITDKHINFPKDMDLYRDWYFFKILLSYGREEKYGY